MALCPDGAVGGVDVRGSAPGTRETDLLAPLNLVEKAQRVMEQDERLGLYAQADRILIEAAAIIPLTYSWSHVLVKPWVRKFPASTLNEWLWKDIVIDTQGNHTLSDIRGEANG